LKTWLRTRDERSATRADDESGSTLIEVLLTTIIVGLASVAIMTSFATTIQASAEHRALATFDNIVTAASQQALSEIQQQPTLFTTCTPLASYPTLSVDAPNTANYTASITAVSYWNGTAFTSTCEENEPQQITVTVNSLVAGAAVSSYSNTFDVSYGLAPSQASSGIAAQLVFTTQPGNGSGGVALTQQPVVEVEDASGNPVTSDLSPVTLSISGSGTLSSCAGSEVGGIVTFSGCTVSSSGTYTLTASDESLPTVQSSSFTISGSPASLVFITQPVAGLSGGTMSTQPKIEIELGGVLDALSTATVTLTSSGGTLAGCSNLKAVLGIVSVSGCTFAGLVGTYYVLEATSSGLVPTQSNSITPSGAGAAAKLAFTTQPSGADNTASTTFTTQPAVTVTDSAGNVVTNYSTAITLSMTGGGTLSCSNKVVTPSSGVATYSSCHGSSYANGVMMTATSGSLSATSQSFNITGAPSALVFTTQPAAGISGTSLVTQPVVTIEDASGNTVTAIHATITLTVTAPASGGTLSVCTGLSTTTGVVNVASCIFSGLVGTNYTLTAASSGVTSAISAAITPTGPGTATSLVVTTPPVAGASGSAFTTQPVVKVEDSGGNVVTSSSVTASLASSGGTLTGCTNLTAVAGVINAANCTFAGVIGTNYTLTASATPLTSATSSSFSPNAPGAASQVLLAGCLTGVVYSTGTCTLTGTVADVYANTVTSYAGNISFAEVSGGTGTIGNLGSVPASSGTASLIVTGSSVGPLQVTASSASPAFTSLPLAVTVTPETLSAAVTASNKTYDGTPTATVSSCTLSPAPAGISCAATAASFAQSNVGNSLVVTATGLTLSGALAVDYTLSNTTANTTANITTAPLTITASSPALTYGSSVPAITPIYSGFVNGQTSSILTHQPTCSTTYTTSSAYGTTPTTSCSGAADSNYTITYVAGSVTITQAVITVTATNTTNTYGTAPGTPIASFSGFVNGQSPSILTTQPTCSTTITGTTGAGAYSGTSNCSGAVAANYSFNYVAGNATVNKAPLTITASSTTLTYGANTPTITASYSGFTSGDTSANLTTQPTCSTAYTNNSSAGTSPSTSCSNAADSNYTITYVNGTVTVTQAPLTITASSTTLTYGANTPTITASYSGFTSGDNSSNLTTQPSCITAYTSDSAAGTTPSTSCSGAADANYTITYVNGTVTVNKAALQITASSTTLTYGSSAPTITPTYSGFTSGDTSANLTTQPSCITAYTTSSAAGTTPSTSCSGAADSNYTITYVNGTVTVNKAPLTATVTIANKTYNGSTSATITACSLSGSTGLTCVYSGATATFASASVANGISVNVTGLTLSGTNSGDYTITTPVTGSANITTATPTITFNSANVSGSAPNQSATSAFSTHYTLSASSTGTGTVTYSVTSQGSTGCTLSGSTLTFSHSGTCTVTASVSANGNYAATTSTLAIDVTST
jgi:type II secretory pathway pseudopilin PulG